jgi:predicted flap endonuclease-1-like 5' DNA nuclease
MDIPKFDMIESFASNRLFAAATPGAMAFHPVLIWSAFAAAGAGAFAGVSRAIAERSEFTGAQAFSVETRAVRDVAQQQSVPVAPVEARSRPILDNIIDQALAEGAEEQRSDTPCRPAGLETPREGKGDDLKRIAGIGPKLEMTLNDLGIFHFDQIAAWGENEIRWIDDYLRFRGRVVRDRWIEQARELA